MSRFPSRFTSRLPKVFVANMIAAAGLGGAALALSATAAAEPVVVAPAVPPVPALSMLQQFANPAGVGAVLQTAATALNGASAVVTGGPATLPVSPIEGVTSAPLAPGAQLPVAQMPVAQMPVGQMPVGPAPVSPGATLAPLLSQLGVPASLATLAPADLPLIGALAQGPTVMPPVAPIYPAAGSPAVSALSALP